MVGVALLLLDSMVVVMVVPLKLFLLSQRDPDALTRVLVVLLLLLVVVLLLLVVVVLVLIPIQEQRFRRSPPSAPVRLTRNNEIVQLTEIGVVFCRFVAERVLLRFFCATRRALARARPVRNTRLALERMLWLEMCSLI